MNNISYILLIAVFAFFSSNIDAQTDYESYLTRGVEAAENYSFNSAEDIFKDARKHSRKEKDNAKKNKFDDLADKSKYLGNSYGAFKSSERAAEGSNFKDAYTKF